MCLGHQKDEWLLTIGLIPDLPVPFLIECNKPRFQKALQNGVMQSNARDCLLLPTSCMFPANPAYFSCPTGKNKNTTAKAGAEGESSPPTIPLLCVIQQVTLEGNFGRELKEDDWLKPCWSQVQMIDRVIPATVAPTCGLLPDM